MPASLPQQKSAGYHPQAETSRHTSTACHVLAAVYAAASASSRLAEGGTSHVCPKQARQTGEQQAARHTIGVDQPNRQEEGQDIAEQPQARLQQPAAVLQVLVSIVALVPHAQHHQRQPAEEKLQADSRCELTAKRS